MTTRPLKKQNAGADSEWHSESAFADLAFGFGAAQLCSLGVDTKDRSNKILIERQ
jgi:hypothetical protein